VNKEVDSEASPSLRRCAGCEVPVEGRRVWCSDACRMRAARARGRTVEPIAGHAEALEGTLEVLSLEPASEALVFYARSLARRLDERPVAWVAREFRQAVLALLALAGDGESAEEAAAHAEFLRLVSTPTPIPPRPSGDDDPIHLEETPRPLVFRSSRHRASGLMVADFTPTRRASEMTSAADMRPTEILADALH
jgi:hypothetical protein